MPLGRRSSVREGTATWSTVASSATTRRLRQRTTRTTQRLAPSAAWRSRPAAVVVPDISVPPDGSSRSAGRRRRGARVPRARHRRASEAPAYASSVWSHVVHVIPRPAAQCGVRHAGSDRGLPSPGAGGRPRRGPAGGRGRRRDRGCLTRMAVSMPEIQMRPYSERSNIRTNGTDGESAEQAEPRSLGFFPGPEKKPLRDEVHITSSSQSGRFGLLPHSLAVTSIGCVPTSLPGWTGSRNRRR
ncbi:hypothetical protein QFZ71_000953 [Streptomyces sp. V2I9]|nr:hypothetical protein [Streptomyces sp. V2I9]